MKIAVTGGSGFVGTRLLESLAAARHNVVSVARGTRPGISSPRIVHFRADVVDPGRLRDAFADCHAVIHLAGINRPSGEQTLERVHVEGTRNVVEAARAVGATKLVTLSFLKARPNCGSRYHETKWNSERIVAKSGLSYTILKAGLIFGPGDGMLTNIWRATRVVPVFASVGFREPTIRPVWVGDVSSILIAAVTGDELANRTVPVVGPEEFSLGEAVRRVARAKNRWVLIVPLPVSCHYAIGWLGERSMRNPIASVAQVRMLAEGISEPLPGADSVPEQLRPKTRLEAETILQSI